MSSKRSTYQKIERSARSSDKLASQDSGHRREPQAESEEYPFICGFSLWAGEDGSKTHL